MLSRQMDHLPVRIVWVALGMMLALSRTCDAQHLRHSSLNPTSPPHQQRLRTVAQTEEVPELAVDPENCSEPGCGESLVTNDDAATLFSGLPHEAPGILFEAIYTGEVFSNTRGGLNTNNATRYRGVAEFVVTTDLETLFGMQGASVFVNAGQMHGRSISTGDVGDWQFVSNIDSTPFPDLTQLNEYWYRQKLGDRFWFKAGRVDANADFGFADLAGDFCNSSFGQMPTIPLPVWPTQSLGATGFITLTDDLLLAVGTFKGNQLAANWGLPVADALGYVTLGHLELKTVAGENELPGTWRLGSWYQSGDWRQITPAAVGSVFGHNYGFWCTADQLLIVEDSSNDVGQGLGVFFEYGWAPEDRNFVAQSFGTGLVYRGLLADRDDDIAGIGLTSVLFGDPTRVVNGTTSEETWEVFYKYQVRSYFSVQPDVQFISNPGGNQQDALVVGLRCEVVL